MRRFVRIEAVLLCLAVLFLAACSETGKQVDSDSNDSTESTAVTERQPEAVISEDNLSEYVIVRTDGKRPLLIESATYINDAVKEIFGYSLRLNNDWLDEIGGEKAPELEILIGDTNRPESEEVLATLENDGDYAVRFVGKKLVIVGKTDTATREAAKRFADEFIKKELFLKEDLSLCGNIDVTDVFLEYEDLSAHLHKELYPGVTSTFYSLPSDSPYGLQKFTVVEFDPEQPDLYFCVTKGGATANKLVTVGNTVKKFNAENGMGLTAISAVNGDLWMVSYAHARIEGKGTTYKDCSDPVVTKSLTVPRGFNIYDGEIITSSHSKLETPYEGDFYSFGVTEDGRAVLGNPQLNISVKNASKGLTASADGLNRLPANNALMVYSDIYSTSNYSLSDAFEIVIDCGGDYTVRHGETVKGKVIAITEPGGKKYDMQANYIILTARGTKKSLLEKYTVGDTVEVSFKVTDKMGNDALWQNMKNAVGGHIPVIIDGRSQGSKDNTAYPASILGIKDNGNVVMITCDGRQSSWSTGVKISALDELCADLGIKTAFLLDGGGSAEMVNLDGDSYKTVNKPSDGSSRTVVNTVIIAYGPKRDTGKGN